MAAKQAVESFVRDTLDSKAGNPDTVIDSKLRHKVLLLDKSSSQQRKQQQTADDRVSKKRRRRKAFLSKRRRESLPLRLDPHSASYDKFTQLHSMWLDYARDALGLGDSRTTAKAIEQRVVKMDLHGARMSVVQSKSPGLVGTTGIVLQEKEHVFLLITPGNRVMTVPKIGCLFRIAVDRWQFDIFGTHFQHKPSDRASRKFKSKKSILL